MELAQTDLLTYEVIKQGRVITEIRFVCASRSVLWLNGLGASC
jgi:hypothetical protein